MPAGQPPLRPLSLDVAALDRAELALEVSAVERCTLHARTLREVLVLDGIFTAAGLAMSSTVSVALARQVSERAASGLLGQAHVLSGLPGGIEAVECGLLGVEQSGAVAAALLPLDADVRLQVWGRLLERLLTGADRREVLPAARVRQLLAGWVIEADPRAAEQRRRAAQARGDVDYRRNDDGLVDVFATGLGASLARAIALRIRERALPWGAADDRPAGQRRLAAFADLLLGRDQLPIDQPTEHEQPLDPPGRPDQPAGHDHDDDHVPAAADAAGGGAVAVVSGGARAVGCRCGCCREHRRAPQRSRKGGRAPCGCLPGTAVPCGVGVTVLLPLGAALGSTGGLAELIGHGPLTPVELSDVLGNSPQLRPVWVDEHGVPVADSPLSLRPARRDPDALANALQRLAAAAPDRWYPRHPADHNDSSPPHTHDLDPDDPDPDDRGSDDPRPLVDARPAGDGPIKGGSASGDGGDRGRGRGRHGGRDRGGGRGRGSDHGGGGDALSPDLGSAAVPAAGGLHPPGTAGAYRPAPRLARFLRARAPRCEWPGCGATLGCDLDHDLAWPDGPTCACNLGPLCRHHHQTKQQLLHKPRNSDSSLTWTSPTGRTWTSPSQHQPPQPSRRQPTDQGPTLRCTRTTPDRPTSGLDTDTELDTTAWFTALEDVADQTTGWTVTGPTDAGPTDTNPADTDRLGARILAGRRWGLDLDNPYVWEPARPLLEPPT